MDVLLVVSFLASLTSIAQGLLELMKCLDDRSQDRLDIIKKVITLRLQYQIFCAHARKLVENIGKISSQTFEIQEVKISVKGCEEQLDRVINSTAIGAHEVKPYLNVLLQIKWAFTQFLEGVENSNKVLIYKSIGTIRHILENILNQLEERYLKPLGPDVPVVDEGKVADMLAKLLGKPEPAQDQHKKVQREQVQVDIESGLPQQILGMLQSQTKAKR